MRERKARAGNARASRLAIRSTLSASDPTVAGTPIGPEGLPQVQLFTHTLNWLLAEGFANGAARAAGHFDGVSLTTKGFSVLNQVPRAVAPKPGALAEKSLGAQFRKAAVSHGTGIAAALIQKMLERQ